MKGFMKTYIGAKIIQAEPMTHAQFLKDQGREYTCEHVEGYKVIYPDNYISWSPKVVFESAYREILDSERELI